MMDQPNDCMKTLGHVSTVHSGLDPRIFWKEYVSLASAGYKVMLLALGATGGQFSSGRRGDHKKDESGCPPGRRSELPTEPQSAVEFAP
ncbi:MAG: hypothetical protein C0398_07370 [Coprothermobacter sp.]|nr:hypothetical protein [Coprothermobacter sp.]